MARDIGLISGDLVLVGWEPVLTGRDLVLTGGKHGTGACAVVTGG
jgi:hypothetical protein